MFSGYIFDVEGTLVDSVPQNLRSLQEALEEAGIDVPYEALQLYSGLDGNQTLQIIAPDLDDALRAQILHGQAQIYESKYLHTVKARLRDGTQLQLQGAADRDGCYGGEHFVNPLDR